MDLSNGGENNGEKGGREPNFKEFILCSLPGLLEIACFFTDLPEMLYFGILTVLPALKIIH
jgi:hypothetical protein